MSTKPEPADEPKPDAGLPPISPDFVEAELGEEIDNIIPTRGYEMTPMVGLGGSAGSIPALAGFFQEMPADSGMVFVVILHLSPNHESTLADLLGRSTSMPVVQAIDGQRVAPNSVYVIPPGKYLATVNGHLKLTDLESERGKRVAVDLFFRSLADTHGPHAVAIVLSGADGDGAVGIKRIKERGGLTIAQDPDQAEYPSMPRASIDTGMVDWVLDIQDMPNRLVEYYGNGERIKLPAEEGPQPAKQPTPPTADDSEAALRDVLVFLRTRTGRDFSYYKRATIVRRIARRMQVNNVPDLAAYLSYLRTHPGEAGALVQERELEQVKAHLRDTVEQYEASTEELKASNEELQAMNDVRMLVESHGGTVEARSEGLGQGSEFVMRLPLESVPESHSSARPTRPEVESPPIPDRVLVVDDNRDAADMVGTLLRYLGSEVHVVHDGPTALEEMRIWLPDVVLLDIGMPGMDGNEVAKRIRGQRLFDSVKLIAVTGWGQEEDRRRCEQAGFDHYLVKPVELDALHKLLASLRAAPTERPKKSPVP